ncbi:ABC transporter permease [Agrobacterium rhizogenes]|nr:ABC transporter permease [Rhizobium rhizogenes]
MNRSTGSVLDGIRLYLRYASTSVSAQRQYKTSFLLQTVGNFAGTIMDFIGTWALFTRFEHFGSWGLAEVAILYGLVNAAFASAQSVSYGFATLGSELLVTGHFDRLLVRPRSVILQLFGQEIRLKQLGRLCQGLVVLFGGLITGGYLSVPNVLICLWCIAGGTMLFIGLFVLQATLSFWTVHSLEIMNVFTHGGAAIAQYPLSIFSDWLRWFITYLIPFAAITYFPALVITGRVSVSSSDGLVYLSAPIAGLIFFLLALVMFKIGMRRYSSAGG